MKAKLFRIFKDEKQTLGEIQIGDLSLFTLELPDLNNDGIDNNEVRKSCIPEGVYRVKKHNSPKFGKTFWVKDVPGRSAILIHPGNYHYHTLGCILVGLDQEDLNGDGLIDNKSSKKAMEFLLEYDITELEIVTI
tara:strand:- start:39 stop:443 length:405 start_codon:yes stop_codon:yes gene_type:complete